MFLKHHTITKLNGVSNFRGKCATHNEFLQLCLNVRKMKRLQTTDNNRQENKAESRNVFLWMLFRLFFLSPSLGHLGVFESPRGYNSFGSKFRFSHGKNREQGFLIKQKCYSGGKGQVYGVQEAEYFKWGCLFLSFHLQSEHFYLFRITCWKKATKL